MRYASNLFKKLDQYYGRAIFKSELELFYKELTNFNFVFDRTDSTQMKIRPVWHVWQVNFILECSPCITWFECLFSPCKTSWKRIIISVIMQYRVCKYHLYFKLSEIRCVIVAHLMFFTNIKYWHYKSCLFIFSEFVQLLMLPSSVWHKWNAQH